MQSNVLELLESTRWIKEGDDLHVVDFVQNCDCPTGG